MARVKRGVTAHAKHKKVLQGRQGLLRPAQEHHPHRQAGGGEGACNMPIRDRKRRKRTLPRALDPAAQRRGAAVRPDLRRFIDGPRQGRRPGRPQGAVRPRDPRAGGIPGDRREGQGRAPVTRRASLPANAAPRGRRARGMRQQCRASKRSFSAVCGMWRCSAACDVRPRPAWSHVSMLGEPVLFGRASRGQGLRASRHLPAPRHPAPLRQVRRRDHRPAPITAGASTATGTCVEIPSLREGQQIDLSKIRSASLSLRRAPGPGVDLFRARHEEAAWSEAEPPRMPVFADDVAPSLAIMLPFPCSTDHAAFGLMDPTHAAYVHTSWWFKQQARKLRPKEKAFEPTELGWRMVRHDAAAAEPHLQAPRQANVSTEISYRLPGLRIEEIARRPPRGGRPDRDHARHRRGDRGAPVLLGDAGAGSKPLEPLGAHARCASSSTRTGSVVVLPARGPHARRRS